MSIEPDLALYAGPRAYRHIQHNGLHAQDIGKLIGSAGGPKALALNGLDQYLFSEWLTSRSDPLWLFASSIAAWRFACAAQADPCAAFEQFAQLYIDCSLPAHACVDAITQATQGMLAALVGKSDRDRRRHWSQAVLQSQRLGEQFARWVDADSFARTVRPLPFP